MPSRFQTFEMPWGFITIDTESESTPSGYVSGPYDVTDPEAQQIEDGAVIEVNEDQTTVIVTPPEEQA